MKRIYLDHNATTPMTREVLSAMLPYLTEEYGNASSIHAYGQNARDAVEQARASVASAFRRTPRRNHVHEWRHGIQQPRDFRRRGRGSRVRSSTSLPRRSSMSPCWIRAEALLKGGIDVTILPINSDGVVNPEDVRSAIRRETVLISLMLANNEIGTIQPIEEIGKIAAEKGIVFHSRRRAGRRKNSHRC